jgi:hypothetical protein
MFKVSLTCRQNSSQSGRGQSILMVAMAAMKCSLKVAMACLAALAQWLCGGASWMLIDLDWIYFLAAEEHLLSITFSVGW